MKSNNNDYCQNHMINKRNVMKINAKDQIQEKKRRNLKKMVRIIFRSTNIRNRRPPLIDPSINHLEYR